MAELRIVTNRILDREARSCADLCRAMARDYGAINPLASLEGRSRDYAAERALLVAAELIERRIADRARYALCGETNNG